MMQLNWENFAVGTNAAPPWHEDEGDGLVSWAFWLWPSFCKHCSNSGLSICVVHIEHLFFTFHMAEFFNSLCSFHIYGPFFLFCFLININAGFGPTKKKEKRKVENINGIAGKGKSSWFFTMKLLISLSLFSPWLY